MKNRGENVSTHAYWPVGYIAGPLGLYGATVLYTHAGYTHCYIYI